MKGLVFDAGPIISLTMNNLLWVLEPLRMRYNGFFYIPEAVRVELIDQALESKKFKFEALQTLEYIRNGTLQVVKKREVLAEAIRLRDLANKAFSVHNHPVKIVHQGEMSVLAMARLEGSDAVVIDERNTRELIEHPEHIAKIMKNRLHARVDIDRAVLRKLQQELSGIRVIRSFELVTVAFELGLLDRYIANRPELKKLLLESVLWGVKLDGCSVSDSEIQQVMKLEKFA
jgi:predicted nucleic acid-binding protein